MNDVATRLITLTCPSCGAKLKLVDGVYLLVCANCGNEHMVHRDGGSIYLAPIAQDVRQIRVGTDKTAAELAIPRLKQEIQAIEAEAQVIRAQSYTHKVKASPAEGWLTVGMMLAFLFTIGGLLTANLWFAGAMGVALLVMAFLYAAANAARIKEAEKLKQIDLGRMQARHTEKSKALARNHQIANG